MKRVLSFILLMFLVFGLCILPATTGAAAVEPAAAESKVKLSTLSEDECMEFLSQMGVCIPEDLMQPGTDVPGIVKYIFSILDEDPYAPLGVSYVPVSLFEDIQDAVRQYYGLPVTKLPNVAKYSLQYSTLSSWDPSMANYNCYAYVLGKNVWCLPGKFSGQEYDGTDDIFALAAVVQDDLKGDLGYNCVKKQISRPSSASGWENVIAVRKDTNYDAGKFNDFHFAKLTSSGWFHKPGGTAVLKFNNPPTNDVIWTNELFDGFTYRAPIIWYESDICYLLYKVSHEITYTSTGQHYHSGARHFYQYVYRCKDCGEITKTVWISEPCSGPPCPIHFSRIDDSLVA